MLLTNLILEHLQQHGSITSAEAFSQYGVTRLSAVIFKLRKRGHNIVSATEHGVNRYGHRVWYVRYELKEAA